MTRRDSKRELPQQMTDVMSRLPINLKKALRLEGGLAIGMASMTCASCKVHTCRDWVDGHEEGEANAIPKFCPVADFFRKAWLK